MAFQFGLIFLALVSILGTHSSLATSRSIPGGTMAERYEQWMKQHGRVYKDGEEKAKRFNIFKNNVEFIDSSNLDETKSYKLAINEFADLSNEEFRASRGGYRRSQEKFSTIFRHENVTNVPASLDWREKGVVTGVKNQFTCGCCWAFSAVAATEGINGIKTGKLVSLSEQELVDCDVTTSNHGCQGGLMDEAFKFIISQGLSTEANYPYQGENGMCDTKRESSRAAKITGYEKVPPNDESALLKAVAKQPVSVAIDSNGPAFQFYAGGIYTGEFCGTNLNHGVTVVGYEQSENGQKYWLVKNSWGAAWGEEGYVKFERDVHAEEGLCGITMDASYPTA